MVSPLLVSNTQNENLRFFRNYTVATYWPRPGVTVTQVKGMYSKMLSNETTARKQPPQSSEKAASAQTNGEKPNNTSNGQGSPPALSKAPSNGA